MTSGIRVSVIITVYKRQVLCERALRSAIAQGIDEMEIIVVDDWSDPPFVLPAEVATMPNVRLIQHNENLGESGARNTGVAAANGEWIAFLDSDDYWPANSLRPRLELAEGNFATDHDPMIIYAAGFILDNKRTGQRDIRIPRASNDALDFASGCWFSQGSTGLFRKETFERVGPCDLMLRRLQDIDWFLRFALAGGRLKIWEHVAAIIQTGTKIPIPALEEAARYLHAKYLNDDSPHRLEPDFARRLEAYLDVERASIFAADKQWFRTCRYLARSIWRFPRLTVHLERFWHREPAPLLPEPAGSKGSHLEANH
jgi:glycosyltransferase involved in cell wall biosynthesis